MAVGRQSDRGLQFGFPAERRGPVLARESPKTYASAKQR